MQANRTTYVYIKVVVVVVSSSNSRCGVQLTVLLGRRRGLSGDEGSPRDLLEGKKRSHENLLRCYGAILFI